jgi:hypothetical protein
MWNSVLSTKGAQYMCLDINFLSHSRPGPIQVHENANIVISDMDYPTISFAKTRTQWFYLPGDATSCLGSSADWNFSKQTPSKMSPPPLLL